MKTEFSRRALLQCAAVVAAGGLASPADALSRSGRKAGIPYGVAVRLDALEKDTAYRRAVIDYCSEIVPEGDLKWGEVQPNLGEFRFEKADAIAQFARENKLELRGHTLVWYAALPYWVDDFRTRLDAERAMTAHIEKVVSRYRGQIKSWDVVNEPMAEQPFQASEMRASVWSRLMGRDYVSFAFRTAAAVDPRAQLVLNEYDIEPVGRRFRLRREGLLALARELKERGDPLHAIGLQSHLMTDRAIDRDGLQEFLVEIKKMGLSVLITELDVVDYDAPSDPAARDGAVAKKVDEYLGAVFDVVKPEKLLTWGISDRYTWVPMYFKRPDGQTNRPLPLDETMRRKPFMDVLDRYRAMTADVRNG